MSLIGSLLFLNLKVVMKMDTNKALKRKYIFVNHPTQYGIGCDKCNGLNIWWSEFEGLIWCYDCEIDTKGTGGIFDGPICFNALRFLGLSLDRYNLETGKIERCRLENGKLIWVQQQCKNT